MRFSFGAFYFFCEDSKSGEMVFLVGQGKNDLLFFVSEAKNDLLFFVGEGENG